MNESKMAKEEICYGEWEIGTVKCKENVTFSIKVYGFMMIVLGEMKEKCNNEVEDTF